MSEINITSKLSQEEILEQAIRRVMAGESPDAILASHGSDASWLKPMLVVVADVRDLRDTVPVPQPEASLAQFLAAAERIRPNPLDGRATHSFWQRLTKSLGFPTLGIPRLAFTAVRVAVLVVILTFSSAIFLGANTIATAQRVLPGAPLYPIKRLGEEIYLRLPQSSESRSAKMGEFEARRRDEVRILLERQREARVSFQGVVEAFDGSHVVVSGVSTQLTEKTHLVGFLTVGARVSVRARTMQDSALVAERIVVENKGQPAAVPSPTATPKFTPTPGKTPSSTATPVDASTPTPAPTKTPKLPAPARIHETDASPAPASAPAKQSPESPEEDHDIDEGVEEDQHEEGQTGDDDDAENSNDAGGNQNGADEDAENSNDSGGNQNGADHDAENSNDAGGSEDGNSNEVDNSNESSDHETEDGTNNAENSNDSGGSEDRNSDEVDNSNESSDHETELGTNDAENSNYGGDGADSTSDDRSDSDDNDEVDSDSSD